MAYVKKILVYMATSTRKLVDPARAAQVGLRGALERVLRDDRGTDDYFKTGKRRIEISVLVHGYQVDTGLELGATEFTYDLKLDKGNKDAGITWSWTPKPEFGYIPGDTSVLTPWISERLKNKDGWMTDSVGLVMWGHGQGVGNDLALPRPVNPRAGVDGIARPSFGNIGGLGDRALARALEAALGSEHAPLDVLVFDSCLMAGVELAYQFRRVSRYLVASQSFVETEPGGPPGLNMGAVVSAWVQRDVWVKAGAGPGDAAKREREANTRLLEAGTDIVNLIGDTRSGAQQLTLFRLEGLEKEFVEANGDDGVASIPSGQWLDDAKKQPTNLRALTQSLDERLGPRVPLDERIQIGGLMRLFTYFLQEAGRDAGERQRILFAFRIASFTRARQFLDLQNLARRVHEFSGSNLLKLVAGKLINELEPRPDGFVVFHRAALPFRERPRFGGVAIYCPWFAAEATPDAEPVWDVMVDHDEYHRLALNRVTEWSAFALGSLYDATESDRERRCSQRWSYGCRCGHGWQRPCHFGCHCCCACGGHWPYGPYPHYPPYPYGPYGFLGPGDKPSGSSLGAGDKPSNGSLGPGDKPSRDNLGVRGDE